jgi:phosphosulfolactate synthase
MNYSLSQLPERTQKPREQGFTMMMDKGLSMREVEDFLEVGGPYTDIVKLGWATSFVVPNLERKLAIYKEAGIPVYLGGTLFEAFIIRNQFDDYRRLLDKFGLEYAEVSDGSIDLNHDKKCEFIRELSKSVKVLSEVGSKDAEKIIPLQMDFADADRAGSRRYQGNRRGSRGRQCGLVPQHGRGALGPGGRDFD